MVVPRMTSKPLNSGEFWMVELRQRPLLTLEIRVNSSTEMATKFSKNTTVIEIIKNMECFRWNSYILELQAWSVRLVSELSVKLKIINLA